MTRTNSQLETAAYIALSGAGLSAEPSDITFTANEVTMILVTADANDIGKAIRALKDAEVNYPDPSTSVFDGTIEVTTEGRVTPRYKVTAARRSYDEYLKLFLALPGGSSNTPEQPDQSVAGQVVDEELLLDNEVKTKKPTK